jgi:hypothetical protein
MENWTELRAPLRVVDPETGRTLLEVTSVDGRAALSLFNRVGQVAAQLFEHEDAVSLSGGALVLAVPADEGKPIHAAALYADGNGEGPTLVLRRDDAVPLILRPARGER